MENREVARILRETAQLLEIDGAMIGRYRSYERVAELLNGLPGSIEELARDRAKLMELPGIGDGMADHIQEILKTGDYVYEANGMVHGATTALEDTDYLFICNGPVLFFNENGFTSYLGWEELLRIQAAHDTKKKSAAA